MEQEKTLQMLRNNPGAIKYIENPTEEMQQLAVSFNGLLIEYIKEPSEEVKKLALSNNVRAMRYITNPTEEMMYLAIEKSWSSLQYIKTPTAGVVEAAIRQCGWAIEYVASPSARLQVLAVEKNEDALKYIKEPCEEAIVAALERSPSAIRFLLPMDQVQLKNLFSKVFGILPYITTYLTIAEVEESIKAVISREEVAVGYVSALIGSTLIGKNSEQLPIDKIQLLDTYGSREAKKIAVDERLK